MSALRAEKVGWRDEALCAAYPSEIWFSRAHRRLAKEICLSCPVIDQCTAYALSSPVGDGVVAGMTPNQVYKLRKELRQ